jgi:hypothetical protein
MKHLKVAGLCLVSMFVMGMALAGNAAATPLWLVCLEASTGLTKYSTNQCTNAESSGKWQSLGLPSGTTTTVRLSTFSLILKDIEAGPLKEKATLSCGKGGTGSAVLESTNKGVIRAFEIEKPKENCARVEGPCKSGEVENVKGVDLPWKIELEGEGWTKIEADGGGEPGWAITCNTLLGSKTDTCTSKEASESAEVGFENTVSSGVLLAFGKLTYAHGAKCSEGGTESGEVEGSVAVLRANGSGLSVKGAAQPGSTLEFSPAPPAGIPVEPATKKVAIKNKLELEITLGVNNTQAFPFVLKGTTCGAALAALAHCEDEIAVRTGTAAGVVGHLIVRADNRERASYELKSE